MTDTNKRKVLHILFGGLGGHANVFFSLIKADIKRDFQNMALFYGVEGVRLEYTRQCDLLNIPYNAHLKRRGLDLKFYFSVFRSIVKSKPDIIFLHSASLIFPVALFHAIFRRTVIITRDTQAHHLKSKSDWIFFRLAQRVTDYFVFLTNESLQDVKKYVRNAGNVLAKSKVIANGIDTSLFIPHRRPFSPECIIIGMQSRLQVIKDHSTLLKAFALIIEEMPGIQFKLRIAGEGPTMSSLKELAGTLKLDSKVEFCGVLNEGALVEFMESLDIYVHATHGETMSNSIMQALSCGLPIVASDVWGVNNMIQNGVTGLLFPDKNEVCLYQCIKSLVLNNDLRIQLSTAARSYAMEHYSLHRLFNEYKPLLSVRKIL